MEYFTARHRVVFNARRYKYSLCQSYILLGIVATRKQNLQDLKYRYSRLPFFGSKIVLDRTAGSRQDDRVRGLRDRY